ncbi:MAG: BolA family transcriptional regulator [Rhodospirillaceae bacterium]|jgi:BolA protein|nr:BolA family transcriptional regulator [Rhodospirillaceae bacterium]
MSVAQNIERKLNEAFAPLSLQVIDESHLHAGHVGARPEGETHFRVEVVSAAFADCSRVDRQRMVYDTLSEELAGPVHALSVLASPP